MAAKKSNTATSVSASRTDPEVGEFMKDLDHPLKKEIEAVRRIILAVSPAIREGIKWNAPSFRTTDDFATFNLRNGRVWLILHTGATARGLTMQGAIADPAGLLKWLAKDRAVITFEDAADVKAKKKAMTAIIQAWIDQM